MSVESQPMRLRCRLGWHKFTNWRRGGVTEYVGDFGGVVKRKRRYYKTCVFCHLDRVKLRKL